MLVKLSINGEKHEADVEPRLLLVHMLRDVLRLTGTHIGCDPLRGVHDPPRRSAREVVHHVRRPGAGQGAHDGRGA
jgi:hypothetical protein